MVGVTGTPGTGKKTVAPLAARALELACISLNDFAKEKGLIGRDGEVDTDRLRERLRTALKAPAVVHGHLLPYCLGRADVSRVLVLRCEPSVLKQRLLSRGYSREKTLDNVEAELIGVVSAAAVKAFGGSRVVELDASYTSPEEAGAAAVALFQERERGRASVDWAGNYDTGEKLRSLLTTS